MCIADDSFHKSSGSCIFHGNITSQACKGGQHVVANLFEIDNITSVILAECIYTRRVACAVPWQWVRGEWLAWKTAGAENTVSSMSGDTFVMPSA